MGLNQKNSEKLVAIVESAAKVSESDKKQLTEVARKIAGSLVEVTFRINPELLGGFTIQVGDRKIDASLKTELSQMIHALKGTSHGK